MAAKKTKAAPTLKRTRVVRPYPQAPFSEVLQLAEAIHKYGAGMKVRRETLLLKMAKSPNSSSTKMLITNSGKYNVTIGSYVAEFLELTSEGATASSGDVKPDARLRARFKLAIEGVAPFNHLFKLYVGKKLPTREVLQDAIVEEEFGATDVAECVDTFVVNVKDLGLLRTISGAETLTSLETAVESLDIAATNTTETLGEVSEPVALTQRAAGSSAHWSQTCFYVTPIGAEGTEQRNHADMFMNSLIEPALKELGLTVVRADKIGAAGMITAQIIEHLMRARLVIVDMSFHNPNVFYEMAIRHACRLPVVQITRTREPLPFDVNQVRTVLIDTTDIYSLVPKLQTHTSEIAAQVRAALADGAETSNPLTLFAPTFTAMTLPSNKPKGDASS